MISKNTLNVGAKLFGLGLLAYCLNCCSTKELITGKTQTGSFIQKKDSTSILQDTSKVKQDSLKIAKRRKTILKPFTFRGDWYVTSWSTGTTLTGNFPIVYGPVEAIGHGAYFENKPDSIFRAYFIGTRNLNRIIEEFEKTNPKLKKDDLRKYMKGKDPGNMSIDYFSKLFSDGKLSEEDLEKYLADGIYGFWYVAKDDKDSILASLPGILEIQYEARKKLKKEEPEKKVEVPDTTKKEYIPKTKELELDSLRQRKLLVDSLYNVLLEKQKLSKITPLEKKDLEKIIKEREDITELIKKRESICDLHELEIGLGYDFDKFYNAEVRYGKKIKYGLIFGYSPKKTRNITTPIINNFYGEGSETTNRYFLGAGFGVDLNKEFTINAGFGLNLENKKVVENIRRNNGEVVAHNRDSYSNGKVRGYTGLDFKVNRFSIGPRIGYGDKLYAGLMARLRF